jgi:peptidoglycan/LPS O-acetylase OafA/YrhL
MTEPQASPKYAFVDALRGIAVLLVILTHTAQPIAGLPGALAFAAKYGQTGVQLFFVASAYTLCLSHARRAGEPWPVASFYLRRVFRIAPLYILGIAVYFGLHLARQSGGAVVFEPYTPTNVAANLFLVHGFVPAANNNIVPGGWSIGTEMAFYALFPLLFVAAARLAARHWLALAGAVAGFAVLHTLAQALWLQGTALAVAGNNFISFSIVNQLPVFGLGLVAWFAQHDAAAAPWPRWARLLVLVAAFALTLALWHLRQPWLFALIPATTALSFVALLQLLRGAPRLPRWLCRVGSVSYSMYIFHFLFAWTVVPWLLQGWSPQIGPTAALLLSLALVLAATFGVAVLSERWIEARGIALGQRLIRRLQRGRAPSSKPVPDAG